MAADPVTDLRRRFTVEEYDLMGRAGLMSDERTELLNGEILMMSPIGPRHASVVDAVAELLMFATQRNVAVRVQNPVRLLQRSEPQPDVVVARRRRDRYASAHPTAEDTLLVVEVADSSLALDRGVKVPIYAEKGIVEVWIVDLTAEVVHVYTDPDVDAYRTVRTFDVSEELVPTALKDVRIAVADIL